MRLRWTACTVYPKKYAHGFCFAVLCCGYTLTDYPISIRLTSLALWQSNDCPSASKATLMNMDKYFMWIHYERLHNHNKAMHNKTVCIFLGIYCTLRSHSKYRTHEVICVLITDDGPVWTVTVWCRLYITFLWYLWFGISCYWLICSQNYILLLVSSWEYVSVVFAC